ncbi:hypothetical protein HanXRQr2_Chr02g0046231 [Helianthus annuus]|uniref:Uncharacterized protein n=1 Tax=Helianthus annuus TaxID=4232 RepID=A0A9K3JKA9_HELAN|nr:hypothetical protein HanXRQr2_Chr02g0046231 [Helianthus annuus]KAJ0950236.1 hypothetical protein HanPSC8_Chr02g0045881 [Helianthus annuus]
MPASQPYEHLITNYLGKDDVQKLRSARPKSDLGEIFMIQSLPLKSKP